MHYINGLWIEEGDRRFISVNPATGDELWQGRAAGTKEIENAVAAARKAFPAWAALDFDERLHYLTQFKNSVELAKEELALLIAQETGKMLWDSRTEVAAVIGKLAFAVEAYHERTGERVRAIPAGGQAVIRHRPHGVMAVYGPYNFPAHLPNGHIMPAILAGNTVVFKPSEQTPRVGQWMVEQWHVAGLPAGVINLVQGERETGIALAAAAIDGVLFTGSTATGQALHAQFAGRPEILLALEMGGNNPLIVGTISDVGAAVYETLLSAFTSTGQRCTCARRVIVIDSPHAAPFVDRLVASAGLLRVGPYNEQPEPFMGPVISMREAQRLRQGLFTMESLGGKALLRMEQPLAHLPFVTPGIVDMTGISHVPDVEYFGPLIQLYRVKTNQEAIDAANKTKFGLSASVLTDSVEQYKIISQSLRAGIVNWNRQTTGASGTGPFGGIGTSGNHRPAGYYSADYCSYPVASVEIANLLPPSSILPGIKIND